MKKEKTIPGLQKLTQLTTVACAGVGRNPAANSSDCNAIRIIGGENTCITQDFPTM